MYFNALCALVAARRMGGLYKTLTEADTALLSSLLWKDQDTSTRSAPPPSPPPRRSLTPLLGSPRHRIIGAVPAPHARTRPRTSRPAGAAAAQTWWASSSSRGA